MSEDAKRALNDKFMLRLPDGMRERIKVRAEANGRSMNSEILEVLEVNFPEDRLSTSDAKKLVQALKDEADIALGDEGSEERRALANERMRRYIEILRLHGYQSRPWLRS